jgi:hypothetical protein
VFMRRALSFALVLLFGPAPLISLLAWTDEPQCQMACCRRHAAAQLCDRHQSPVSDSSSLRWIAADNCPPGCAHLTGAPSPFAGFLPTSRYFSPLRPARNRIPSGGIWTARSVIDSFLHQRPPPLAS